MKSLKLLSFFAVLSLSLCLTSCGAGGGGCDNSSEDWLDAVSKFSDVQMTYLSDPSDVNCDNYRSAYLDYIDALEELLDCADTFAEDIDLDAAIADARLAVNDLEC